MNHPLVKNFISKQVELKNLSHTQLIAAKKKEVQKLARGQEKAESSEDLSNLGVGSKRLHRHVDYNEANI